MPEYRIEDSIYYRESTEIAGLSVYIFEFHNLALPAWGTVSSRLGAPLKLVTFLMHTRTRTPHSMDISLKKQVNRQKNMD